MAFIKLFEDNGERSRYNEIVKWLRTKDIKFVAQFIRHDATVPHKLTTYFNLEDDDVLITQFLLTFGGKIMHEDEYNMSLSIFRVNHLL